MERDGIHETICSNECCTMDARCHRMEVRDMRRTTVFDDGPERLGVPEAYKEA